MEVICLEDTAFFALVKRVVERIKEKAPATIINDKWISGTEAMNLLRIKSKTTLQKLRDEGKTRFTQPEKRLFYATDNQLKIILKISLTRLSENLTTTLIDQKIYDKRKIPNPPQNP